MQNCWITLALTSLVACSGASPQPTPASSEPASAAPQTNGPSPSASPAAAPGKLSFSLAAVRCVAFDPPRDYARGPTLLKADRGVELDIDVDPALLDDLLTKNVTLGLYVGEVSASDEGHQIGETRIRYTSFSPDDLKINEPLTLRFPRAGGAVILSPDRFPGCPAAQR